MPADYEGRYFASDSGLAQGPDPWAQAFERRTYHGLRWALDGQAPGVMAGEVLEAGLMAQAIAQNRARAAHAPWQRLWHYLPLCLYFAVWLAWLFPGTPRGAWAAQSGLAAGAVGLGLWAPSSAGWSLVLSALVLALGARLVGGRAGLRVLAMVLVLVAMAAATGFWAEQWTAFFHTRGGFRLSQPLFYAMLPLGGLLLAWVWGLGAKGLARGSTLVALGALPAGVYYYQSGQNFFWGLLLGGALWSLWQARALRQALWAKPVGRVAMAGLGASAALMLAQEAGGWVWNHFPSQWLSRLGEPASLVAYLVATLAVGLAVWSVRGQVQALAAVLGAMGLTALMTVGVGQMPLHQLAASQVVLVFFAALLVLAGQWRGRHPAGGLGEEATWLQESLWLWACALGMAWFNVRGFLVQNIDFAFAFDFAEGLGHSSQVFAVIFVLASLKYGMPLGLFLWVYGLVRGIAAQRAAMALVLWWLGLRQLTLFAQIFFSAAGNEEKLYELAASEVIFVFLVGFFLSASHLVAEGGWRLWPVPWQGAGGEEGPQGEQEPPEP